jgi:UDP-N-acetylmuramoyl-tripeptide--D-alanyl-D-alanine ligase
MIKMNAAQVAQIIEGKLSGEATLQNETEFKFDSREIQAGDVFLALLGEHADGHDFVNQALQNGAVLSIVSKSVTGPHISSRCYRCNRETCQICKGFTAGVKGNWHYWLTG